MKPWELRDKSILITGGSRGLGRALALALAERGARVGITGRSPGPLREVEREIREAGGFARAFVADAGDQGAIYPLAAQAAEALGPVEILICNASTLGAVPLPILLDTECEDFVTALQTNVVGPFRLAKAMMGPMLLNRRGLVLNLSSDAAISAYPGWGMYSATKAALDQLTRVWAEEVEGTGVKLVSVDPGEMNTVMHADAIPGADRNALADPSEIAGRFVSLISAFETLKNGSRVQASDFEISKGREEKWSPRRSLG